RVFKLKILGSSGFSVEFIHNFPYLEGSSITPLLEGSFLRLFYPSLEGRGQGRVVQIIPYYFQNLSVPVKFFRSTLAVKCLWRLSIKHPHPNPLPSRERVLFYPHNPQKNQILFLCVLCGEIHFLWFHIFSSFFMKLLTLPTHLSSGLRTPRMFFIAT
ncbi:MAG: hypothetical protein Q8P40_02385, partial [Nitrospirota bacterium]|nr:hypothetical protein [Nitrospirota bacterium]